MHYEFQTMGGRHLVYAYAAVFLIQGGYIAWVAKEWFKTKAYGAKKINEVS